MDKVTFLRFEAPFVIFETPFQTFEKPVLSIICLSPLRKWQLFIIVGNERVIAIWKIF